MCFNRFLSLEKDASEKRWLLVVGGCGILLKKNDRNIMRFSLVKIGMHPDVKFLKIL